MSEERERDDGVRLKGGTGSSEGKKFSFAGKKEIFFLTCVGRGKKDEREDRKCGPKVA